MNFKKNMMTNFFLKMKHWQLFAITIGIVFIFQITFIINSLMMDMFLLSIFYYYLFFLFCPFVILVLWFYSIGHKINSLLPEGLKINEVFFKITSFFPIFYFFIIFLFFGFLAESNCSDFNPIPLFIFIVPSHLFAMFCMFYLIYFCSKTFKTFELQKSVRFNDYAGEFVLLWFFPIGIWIIQPRINKIFEEHFDKRNTSGATLES
jgi:hypothetical protein